MWQRGWWLMADTSECDNVDVRRDEEPLCVFWYRGSSSSSCWKKKQTNTNNLDIEGMLGVAQEYIGIRMPHRKQTREYGNRSESNRIKISLLQSMTI